MLALVFLTSLSVLAATGITTRIRTEGRAEQVVAVTILWNVLILAPIYGLGIFHELTATNLALASLAASGAALAASSYGRPPREHARDVRLALSGLARLPLDGLLLVARPLGFLALVFTFAGGLILYSAVSAYYAHCWKMWDAPWYHEPIVAFTIQQRGFDMLALPNTLQRINSMPRASEMTDLWFAIFAGRKVVDLANSLLCPALLASAYLLCARFARSRSVALGWACVVLLMPGTVWELGTTFVDLHLTLVELAALWFATRKELDLGHCALAACALAIAVGIKFQAVVPVAILAPAVLARLWLGASAPRLHKLAVTLGGAALIAGVGAHTYLRNYLAFHNPVWPFLVPGHPTWPGSPERGQDMTKSLVDLNLPWSVVLKELYSPKDATYNYGLGFGWVILPLFALAAAVLIVHVVGCVRRRGRALPDTRGTDWRSLVIVVAVCIPAAGVAWASPALNQGRYHGFVFASMIALVAWMTGASRLGGLAAEGAIAAAFLLTVANYRDAEHRYIQWPSEVRALARLSPDEREVATDLCAVTEQDTGLARERDLGPGDLVAFGNQYGGFPGEFFNNSYSNRAVYLPDARTFVDDARNLGAKWIYCEPWSHCMAQASRPGAGWEMVGELHAQSGGVMFRRVDEPPDMQAGR